MSQLIHYNNPDHVDYLLRDTERLLKQSAEHFEATIEAECALSRQEMEEGDRV